MKLYTFLDGDENIIEEVRAESHAIAYKIACDNRVDLCTEFYSETIGKKEEIRKNDLTGIINMINRMNTEINKRRIK